MWQHLAYTHIFCDVGGDVLELQRFLNDQGYFPRLRETPDGYTGYFSDLTKEALQAWQKDYHLAADGRFGQACRQAVARQQVCTPHSNNVHGVHVYCASECRICLILLTREVLSRYQSNAPSLCTGPAFVDRNQAATVLAASVHMGSCTCNIHAHLRQLDLWQTHCCSRADMPQP